MGNLVEVKFNEEGVDPEDVLDAISGYVEKRSVKKLICIGEDADNNLSIITTDMTNTELIGTLNIAIANYIHIFQHE